MFFVCYAVQQPSDSNSCDGDLSPPPGSIPSGLSFPQVRHSYLSEAELGGQFIQETNSLDYQPPDVSDTAVLRRCQTRRFPLMVSVNNSHRPLTAIPVTCG